METYPWNSSDLAKYRSVTDNLATDIVNQLKSHYKLEQIDSLFRHIPAHFRNNDFPEFLESYLDDLGALPSWIDHEKIKRAQKIFWSYGRESLLALLFRSLPMCYICHNGAEVLATTGRLIDKSHNPKYERRLLETLQFVINVCSDDYGFEKNGLAITTIKRIRLIHETIRQYILQNTEWPSKERGEPINQEDQLITISAFSIEVIFALEKMGVYLTDEEKDDWCHLWSCTGFILGIKEELLPQSYDQYLTMKENILATQMKSSQVGYDLVNSCVVFMTDLIPFHILHSLSYSTIKYLNDEPYRTIMGLTKKHSFWDRVIPGLMKNTLGIDQKLEKKSALLRLIINKLNQWLLRGLVKIKFPNGTYFYLPNSLKN